MKQFTVDQAYEAIDINASKRTNRPVKRFFQKGELVWAEVYPKDGRMVLIDKKYIFPQDYLIEGNSVKGVMKKTSNFTEVVENAKEYRDASEAERDKLSKVGSNVADVVTGKTKDRIKSSSSGYKNGALVGAAAGVLTALYFKKKIWVFALGGVVLGGYVGYKITETQRVKYVN